MPIHGTPEAPPDSPADVAALVDRLERDGASLTDRFAYLAGTRPDWFRPHQERVIDGLLDRLDVAFDDLCVLLAGAPDRCVDRLAGRLREDWSFRDAWALAAIGTDAALAAVAADVRAGAAPREYEDCGVWVPPSGPAVYRFTPHRQAARLRLLADRTEVAAAAHPVGLAPAEVADGPGPIVWHYLSLRAADVPGLPPWPADRIHLVGAAATCVWTLTARVGADGRYREATLVTREPLDEPPADSDFGLGAVDLRPYGHDLVYANGHIHLTPGVVGTVGGPPLGVYRTPSCPSCGRLMFHVATVENYVREYGDGWRSLFLCAECERATCTATGWN